METPKFLRKPLETSETTKNRRPPRYRWGSHWKPSETSGKPLGNLWETSRKPSHWFSTEFSLVSEILNTSQTHRTNLQPRFPEVFTLSADSWIPTKFLVETVTHMLETFKAVFITSETSSSVFKTLGKLLDSPQIRTTPGTSKVCAP